MLKSNVTLKKQRERRFYLVLPLLVLPFITLAFWAFGGGTSDNNAMQANQQGGFNPYLPDALNDTASSLSKMDYYNRAQEDSLKLLELINNDPAYQHTAFGQGLEGLEDIDTSGYGLSPSERGLNTSLYGNSHSNEAKIYEKLAALESQLKQPQPPAGAYGTNPGYGSSYPPYNNQPSPDVQHLEQMIETMQEPEGEDKDIAQLNGMLEKVLDIQHPDRVQQQLSDRAAQKRGRVYTVAQPERTLAVSTMTAGGNNSSSGNGFYSLTSAVSSADAQNAVQAVVHQDQTVTNGSTVKLRLLDDITINGVLIPKGQFVYGICALDGERLNIKIAGVRYQQSLLPVELSVFDMDGIAGVHIPGAITRDVAKESADRSVQDIGLASVDPSWGAQAASAGIEAAKTLFSKRVRLIKVTLKAGYRVLLRDEKQKQDQATY